MSSDVTASLRILEEPGGLEAVLLNASEMTLLLEVQNAAATLELSPGEFASLAVRRFIERAGNEDWASLTSRANAMEDAMAGVVAVILWRAVGDVKAAFP